MPKMKGHKSSVRRLRLTKNGKILRRQCGVRHLLTNRSAQTRRQRRAATSTTTVGYVKKVRLGNAGTKKRNRP